MPPFARAVLISLTAAWVCAGAVMRAQSPDVGQPAPSNVQTSPFPRINDDGTVTFRVRADRAQSVAVEMPDFGTVPLVSAEGGFWIGTTATPMPPGFYYYTIRVDGFVSNDPGSQTFYGWNRYGSGLEVPGPDSALWSARDVPHGVVREQHYFSRSRNEWRRIRVYTPPGYDTSPAARYPVLYLQHGAGENETSWTNQGRAAFILDNLLADGRIRPMIVVNENGVVPAPASAPAQGRGGGGGGASASTAAEFDTIVVRDLVPFIDASYRTIANRDSRAIAGLSMGGGQAMRIGINHLDLFSAIGLFSGAVRNLDPATAYDGKLADASAVNQRLRLLWIGMGTGDRLYEAGKVSHENLEKAGVKHVWVETPGGHVWSVWRRFLAEFAPLVYPPSR